jgi:hypothetical protein
MNPFGVMDGSVLTLTIKEMEEDLHKKFKDISVILTLNEASIKSDIIEPKEDNLQSFTL